MIMIPSARFPQQPLQGFAAFAAAAEAEAADVDGEVGATSGKDAPGNVASKAASSSPPTLDDFELLRLVGAGGFGKVYQCRKKSSGRIMALKAMRKHLVIEELNVEGTRNERSVLETIQHPFIVRLHCAFHDTGRLYLLMDWHNGGHLLRLLHEKSPLSENETRFYLAELVLAIEGLHEQGIVHRDLKPENVLIDCRGHLVVTDFGASKIALAHEAEEDGDIRTNSWVGTEMYMAPEQLLGLVYGRVVDWWAIGVLAFEMLSGENPFYHDNPEQVAIKVQRKKLIYSKHLSGPCVSLLKGLLTREPERRLGKGGPQEVKSHPFFKHKGFKWQAIYDRTVEPPFDFGVVCSMYLSMTAPPSLPVTLVLRWVCSVRRVCWVCWVCWVLVPVTLDAHSLTLAHTHTHSLSPLSRSLSLSLSFSLSLSLS
jgi:serine/threonine protein kinase